MTVLVADIGATHARFALTETDADVVTPQSMMVAGLPCLESALNHFFEASDIKPAEVTAAVLCAAGPVRDDGSIHMTNCPWIVDPRTIGATFAFPSVRILNDLTAMALGLLRLEQADADQFGGAAPVGDAPKAILAAGTGLGVSGLIPSVDGAWSALASEGGHADLAPHTEREIAIVFHLLRQFGHASRERVLSGLGLEALYKTLGALDGGDARSLAAVDIANAARRGEPQAEETISLFCSWFGAVAGDIALTLGAKGGVYLAGGIIPQWPDLFDRSLFRRRFEAKGRFDEYLKPIPTYIVKRGDLALLGCLEEARRLLG